MPFKIQSEHFTDGDIKEISQRAFKQGIIPACTDEIESYAEFLLFLMETAWEAGYEARLEGK